MTDETKNQPSELEVAAHDNTVTTSTGCVFECKQVPPYLFMSIIAQLDDPPEPPKILDKNFPKWQQDNEDAEWYQELYQKHQAARTKKMLDVFVGRGTELVKKPADLEGWDDKKPQWIDDLEELGLEVKPDNKSWRYLNWVLTVAAPTDDDLKRIQEKVKVLTGVPEEDVAKAAKFSGS